MRAVTYKQYGEPTEVLELVDDRQAPKPQNNEVRVRIEASSINAADLHMVRADYLIVRLVLGLFGPAEKNQIPGEDFAGTIDAIGEKVEGFEVGDAVAADIRTSLGGGFAEYCVVKAEDLVKKPTEVSFEQAATVPISGQAAMMGLILCALKPGHRILIRGASGGVGSFAVQIAKAQGAHVTAICSAAKADAVKSWGADDIVNYQKTSIEALNRSSFDAVFDAASFGSPRAFSAALKDDGRYVLVGGSYYNMLMVKFLGRIFARRDQKFMSLTQEVTVTRNIESVFAMIAQGLVKPAIQKTISLREVPDAIASLGQRSVVGKVVVKNQS